MTAFKHKLVRPPADAREVLRWDGKKWSPDNGKPALAFIWRGPPPYSAPMAGASRCQETLAYSSCDDVCIYRQALDKCCRQYHCANGEDLKPVRKRATKRT